MLELRYSGNSITISDVCYEEGVEKYNTSFALAVQSDGFQGHCNCVCDIAELETFSEQVNELYRFQRSVVELRELTYGSYLVFELDSKTGHIQVSGELIGEGGAQHLRFLFEADQSSIKPFADALKKYFKAK